MSQTTKKDKMKLLFICLGNICRSPAAEGIMAHLIEEEGEGHRIEVDSAGIGNWHVGQLPDRRMRAHGARHGYNFCSRARQIRTEDFDELDLLLVMDADNWNCVRRMAPDPEARDKVRMRTDFLSHHPNAAVVPDPYYGGDADFEWVIELLEDACQGLLEHCRRCCLNR